MTIGGALSELNNLLKADDIPCYYKPSIKAVIDTIALDIALEQQPYVPDTNIGKMSEIPTDCSNLDPCENCKYNDGECCRMLYEAKMESEE